MAEMTTQDTMRVCIRLFERFEVTVDGVRVPDARWRLRKARDLVKLLALVRGHRLHREQVLAVLWPERDPHEVANNLHQVLHVARRAFDVSGAGASDVVRIEGQMIALAPPGGLDVDVLAFEAAARQARREGTVAAHLAALALGAGELLPEDRYEDWVEERRVALAAERRDLLRWLSQHHAAAGHWQGAVESLHELEAADPDDGWARRALDDALAAAGSASAAGGSVAADQQRPVIHNLPAEMSSFVGREELLMELDSSLRSARLLTLSGPGGVGKTRLALALARASLDGYPDGAWFVDLGGIPRSSAVPAALAGVLGVRATPGEPLLEALAGTLGSSRTLVVLDTCEHVLEGCTHLVERLLSTCRALTIVATSRELLRISGEVVWRVPPLSLPSPDATEPAMVQRSEAVRLFVERAQAASPRFVLATANAAQVAHVCTRLDGLPLAVELAAGRLAVLGLGRVVDRLDQRLHLVAAGGRSLITRQQTLRATIEWSHDLLTDAERMTLRRLAVFVAGFDLDAAEAVCSGGSVAAGDVLELIIRLVDKSLVDVDDVEGTVRYRLLDTIREYAVERLREAGELDATRLRHAAFFIDLCWRVRQHLGRADEAAWLRSIDPEQENLRAAFDHSLVAQPARALELAAALWPYWLRRLQLAEGTRRLDEALAAAPAGHEKLRAQALLGAAAIQLRSGRATAARAALRSAVEHGRAAEDAATVSWALLVLQGLNDTHRHGLEEDASEVVSARMDEATALAAAAGLSGHLAAVHYYRGVTAYKVGDGPAMRRHFDSCLELLHTMSETAEPVPSLDTITGLTAVVGRRLGPAVLYRSEAAVTRVDFDETLQPFFELPPRAAEALVRANTAVPRILGADRREVTTDDIRLARAELYEALRLAEVAGDDRTTAEVLSRVGNLERGAGEPVAARAALERCLELRRRLGDARGIGLSLVNLGSALAVGGDAAAAEARMEEGLALFRRTGDPWGMYVALGRLAELAARAGQVTVARRRFADAVDQLRRIEAPRWLAWGLLGLADLDQADGDAAAAHLHLIEARALFADINDNEGLAQVADGQLAVARTPIRS